MSSHQIGFVQPAPKPVISNSNASLDVLYESSMGLCQHGHQRNESATRRLHRSGFQGNEDYARLLFPPAPRSITKPSRKNEWKKTATDYPKQVANKIHNKNHDRSFSPKIRKAIPHLNLDGQISRHGRVLSQSLAAARTPPFVVSESHEASVRYDNTEATFDLFNKMDATEIPRPGTPYTDVYDHLLNIMPELQLGVPCKLTKWDVYA